jgi:hypothetical protein
MLLRRAVSLQFTDFSEKLAASIIRAIIAQMTKVHGTTIHKTTTSVYPQISHGYPQSLLANAEIW